jgi:8-oxo-dGTP pyrophosphatase MutT (NUDIX family)
MGKQPTDREVSAGGIIFRRLPGQPPHFLLIRDSYRNWGFPKGHLEDGETPAEAGIFFLFESPAADFNPEVDEGITECRWYPLDEALRHLSYDNARGVLKRAGEMCRTLVAVGAGRPKQAPTT